jgi:hypothetical protein
MVRKVNLAAVLHRLFRTGFLSNDFYNMLISWRRVDDVFSFALASLGANQSKRIVHYFLDMAHTLKSMLLNGKSRMKSTSCKIQEHLTLISLLHTLLMTQQLNVMHHS